jgi:glycosyltransferase involved in cell wall biosynthesis
VPKIIYFTKYTEAGPSSRYRSYQYKNYLETNGFEVITYALFPTKYIHDLYGKGKKNWLILIPRYIQRFFQLMMLRDYDILFVEYELFPFLPFFLETIVLFGKKNIVLDYDDATFHTYDKSQSKLVQFICGKKIYQLVAKASLVIAGSPYLTEVLSKYNNNVTEIPTSISYKRYQQSSAPVIKPKNEIFKIGWVGSKNTSVNILPLKEVFLELQKKYTIELCLVGFDKKLLAQLEGVNCRYIEWNAENEVNTIYSFDVGIMPLEDKKFNYGKCGFKLIQYMACGIPTISTPLPANVKINRDNHNLFAINNEEWLAAFEACIGQKENLKKSVGEKNREIVKQFYCTEANYLLYLDSFNQLLKSSTEHEA